MFNSLEINCEKFKWNFFSGQINHEKCVKNSCQLYVCWVKPTRDALVDGSLDRHRKRWQAGPPRQRNKRPLSCRLNSRKQLRYRKPLKTPKLWLWLKQVWQLSEHFEHCNYYDQYDHKRNCLNHPLFCRWIKLLKPCNRPMSKPFNWLKLWADWRRLVNDSFIKMIFN